MANNQLSTDFSNNIRNVQAIFDTLVAQQPTLMSLIRVGAPARATKEEWLEDSLVPSTTTIASFDTDGTGTGINVASTTGMVAGQILRFESSAGADRGELVKIASVDSATNLTVVRLFGGNPGSAVTLATGDVVYTVSKPREEKSSASADAGYEETTAFNYTQIFRRTAELSRTAMTVANYGVANSMAAQIERHMLSIMAEVNNQLIWGEKELRTGSNKGSFGGILSFLRGGNVDTTGSALSATIINNLLEAVYADGASSNNYAIVCAPNQAKRISGFNTAGSNPVVSVPQGSTTAGGYISTFIGNLPVQNGPFTARVVVEPNFPKDKVALVDLNRIELAYLTPFGVQDATTPGMDGIAETIIGELTVRIKDGQKAHAMATGLTV